MELLVFLIIEDKLEFHCFWSIVLKLGIITSSLLGSLSLNAVTDIIFYNFKQSTDLVGAQGPGP